jgi:DNA-binding transcriptional MerR regulator
MKEDLLPIGKMAALNRVSIPTLRLYDEKGLLKPRYIDPETGYRYYDISQNARLDMIVYMKELGMSLSEIAQALQKEDMSLIEELLSQKNEQIHQQMRQLQAQHDAVERAIMSIERYRKSPVTGTLSLEYIDRRYIWGIPCSSNFYSSGIHCYERLLRDLRLKLEENGFQQIHSYNIGTSITREDYEADRFTASQIFIFTSHRDQNGRASLQTVESGMYACVYLDNYDDEISCAKKLRDYCRSNDYHIAGDYICEVMTGFNVFDSDPRSMFLRLQVPVTFQKAGSEKM